MRIVRRIAFLGACFLLGQVSSDAQLFNDPPPADAGELIGVPTPGHDDIPVAEPVTEEYIPIAEPVVPAAGPAQAQGKDYFTPVIPQSTPLPVEQGQTQVAVLGYHDFSDNKPITEMRMSTSTFRQQMQALKNSRIPVISLKEFIDWKTGQGTLPPYCVLITIDDGWKSVYTDAYPILKEMGFPFTLFLYTKFVTGQGSSLSADQVMEMMRNGASIGSHSTSHLYPSNWKAAQRKGPENYRAVIDKEIGESKKWLETRFPTIVSAYCYPGGYHTEEMIQALPEFGYSFAVTVIPRKTLHSTNNWQIPRYMVYGNNLQTFKRAVVFEKINQAAPSAPGAQVMDMPNATLPVPAQVVHPAANSVTTIPCPAISIILTNTQDIALSSLEMRVSGFGKVPAKLVNADTTLLWQPNRPLRTDVVKVIVSWKNLASGIRESVEWEFGTKASESILKPVNLVN